MATTTKGYTTEKEDLKEMALYFQTREEVGQPDTVKRDFLTRNLMLVQKARQKRCWTTGRF
mgnify:CR=1 FL=1